MQIPQKIILSIGAIVFSLSVAQAQVAPLSGSLKKLNQLNKKNVDCTTCDAGTAGIEANFAKCKTDICGTTSPSYLETFAKYSIQAAYMPDSAVQDVADAFDNYVQSLDINRKKFFADISKAFQNQKIKIDPQLHSLAAFYWLQHFNNDNKIHFSLQAKGDGYAYEIDKEKTAENLNKLGVDKKIQDWVLRASHMIYSTMDADAVLFPPEIYFKKKYPQLTLTQAVQKVAQNIKDQEDSVKKNPRFAFIITAAGPNNNDIIIDKAAANQELTSSELKNLMSIQSAMPLLMAVISSDFEKIAEEVPLSTIEDRLNSQSFRKDVMTRLEKQNAIDLKSKGDEAKKGFLLAAKVNQLVLPKKEEKDNFQKVIDETKSAIISQVTPHFSTESRIKLNKKITADQFMLPRSNLEDRQYLIGQLNSAASDESDSDDNSPIGTQMKVLETLSMSKDEIGDKLDGIADHCGLMDAAPLNDANYTSYGAIQVSWTSIKNPKLGMSVIAHEIGHTLFHTEGLSEQSSRTIEQMKLCLSARHRNLEPDADILKYSDEDFADLVSAHATDKDVACLFDYSSLTGSLKSSGDEHSTDFFRLLSIDSEQKGSIPDSCQDYLKSQGQTVDFAKSCF